MSTDAKDLHGVFQRLGTPGDVARSAAHEFRQARFSRRHPVLMFLVLPVLSLPVLWVASIMGVIAMFKLLGMDDHGKVTTTGTLWQTADAAVPYFVVAILVLPIAASAAFFSRLASRAGVNWRWSLAACSLLAILGGAAMTNFVLPTQTSRGSFSFGFGISTHPSAAQVLQFLLPLAICGWAVWRQLRVREQPSQLA